MRSTRGTGGAAGGRARDTADLPEEEYEEEEYEEDDTAGGDAPRLTAMTAVRAGRRCVAELIDRPVEGVTLVRPASHGWTVEMEVVEDHRVPSSGDTLAIYRLELDEHGELMSCTRVRVYKRAKGDTGAAVHTGGHPAGGV